MTNPHLLRAHYAKRFNPAVPDEKRYVGYVGHGTRRVFKTATKALGYAERVIIRWRRLYDAAVAAASAEETTVTA